ncbi:MAG: hypothetical protein PHC61_14010 [Chitinivibrionales bacterium]|nr:hypothetical protein [Chitinivibrionales bacterium]
MIKYFLSIVIIGSLVITGTPVLAGAQTPINGPLQKFTLDSTGNPYFVTTDLVVPAGKKLTIKEGCVFLFKEFTGIHISGSIAVNGTANHPVVFTSVNDAVYNKKSEQAANPFDWNGILIDRGAPEAAFNNIGLSYSVYGIKAQSAAITVKNGLFKQNGQFHFTINDKIQFVQDNIPYSYGVNEAPDNGKASVTLISDADKGQPHKASTARLVVRYSSLGVGVVGIAAGTIFYINYLNAVKNQNALSPTSSNQAVWNDYENKRTSNGPLAAIFYGLAGAGLIGFGCTYWF